MKNNDDGLTDGDAVKWHQRRLRGDVVTIGWHLRQLTLVVVFSGATIALFHWAGWLP
jgi:hypothetical protein